MQIRKAIVADQFYPGQHDSCIEQTKECLDKISYEKPLPETVTAGIVPHAGWMFSGDLAGLLFSKIKERHDTIHTFIIFGAAHGYFGNISAICDSGYWETPLGQIAINEELAESVINSGTAISDPQVHNSEHSIEVQVPFIQYLFPGSKILPILVPPRENAIAIGEAVGTIISQDKEKKIICIASTDLTHYGPRYGFIPMGIGQNALEWAHKVNDMKFIELALKMEPEELLNNSAENGNACGPGAVAAAIAAAKKLGSQKGLLLGHTNSNEVLLNIGGQAGNDSVGYASIIY
ncbi:MAG: AmmeMemoRadiSam system protein B [Sedimentisphaerales bacterium]|nr:AmmeMemoRadiSam system protein B [Sedimentisphaerales bacterium]